MQSLAEAGGQPRGCLAVVLLQTAGLVPSLWRIQAAALDRRSPRPLTAGGQRRRQVRHVAAQLARPVLHGLPRGIAGRGGGKLQEVGVGGKRPLLVVVVEGVGGGM
jgi:hypothetical protein